MSTQLIIDAVHLYDSLLKNGISPMRNLVKKSMKYELDAEQLDDIEYDIIVNGYDAITNTHRIINSCDVPEFILQNFPETHSKITHRLGLNWTYVSDQQSTRVAYPHFECSEKTKLDLHNKNVPIPEYFHKLQMELFGPMQDLFILNLKYLLNKIIQISNIKSCLVLRLACAIFTEFNICDTIWHLHMFINLPDDDKYIVDTLVSYDYNSFFLRYMKKTHLTILQDEIDEYRTIMQKMNNEKCISHLP